MKKLPIVIFLVILMVIGSGCTSTQKTPRPSSIPHQKMEIASKKISGNVYVLIDPRVELVEIIYRLSDSGWYHQTGVAPEKLSVDGYGYVMGVDEYFGRYKDAKAVQMVRKLSKNGLTYDAIPRFAIHLNPETFELERNWSDMLRDRPWLAEKELNEFADAVKEFAEETNFWEFYNGHLEFYNRTIEEFLKENPNLADIPKFEEEFFGEKPKGWYIVLQTALARHSFGGWIGKGKDKEIYGFLGICHLDRFEGIPRFCPALVHEFAHSFVNPAVDRNYELFKPYESLYNPVKEKMAGMAYSDFKNMLHETLVRAFEAYYIKETEGEAAAETRLAMEKASGFHFIDDVYKAYVEKYVPSRAKYRTFDDFMPALAKVIGEVYERTNGGKEVKFETGPTVREFVEKLSEEGGIIIYDGNSSAALTLAGEIGKSLKIEAIPGKQVNEGDLKKNLVFVVLSNSSLLKELQAYMDIKVSGEEVHSEISGKTYKGSIRVFEVIRNPWSSDKLIFIIIGTEEESLRSLHAYGNLHYSIRDADSDEMLEAG
ncbi:DUF4932 domain-containing protein [Palaeococcus sp. (in: euryarchaeotes)]